MADFKIGPGVNIKNESLELNVREYNDEIVKKLPENPKVFISLPMRGKSKEEVRSRQDYILNQFLERHNIINAEFIDSYIKAVPLDLVGKKQEGAWCLGDSIKQMSFADVVIFSKDYQSAKGCMIEHVICMEYGFTIMFEEDEEVEWNIRIK